MTSIGEAAFYGCTGLTSVTFEENSQLTSIGYNAFYGCTGLIEINYNATNLADLSSGIFTHAGYDGAGIVVNIGANVQRIPAGIFRESNITSVNFAENSQCAEIGGSAFYGCSNIANVYYGGTIDEWIDISFGGYSANPLIYM